VLIGVLGTIVVSISAQDKAKGITHGADTNIFPYSHAKLPEGAVNQTYHKQLYKLRAVAPWKWTVTPPLPPDLALDEAHGTISGTPKAPLPKATFAFTVTDSSTPQSLKPENLISKSSSD